MPTDVEAALDKEIKYTVKPKVTGTTNDTAGKYAKRDPLKPGFGTVHTITY